MQKEPQNKLGVSELFNEIFLIIFIIVYCNLKARNESKMKEITSEYQTDKLEFIKNPDLSFS